jgi:two-component system, chemotaxis family, sensor kinase CheA
MSDARQPSTLSIPKLRNLIIVCLVIGVAAYTAVMFLLADRLSQRFGPQVRIDLEWRVQRGAQELARAADLGLAVSDSEIVTQAFGVYAHSEDVLAIVAVDTTGATVAQHGKVPESVETLFSGEPGGLRQTRDYLVSWKAAEIEGAPVGKVAVVVSTRRLQEASELLSLSSNATLIGGLAALVLGVVVVLFFTRVVAQRDAQLSDYAANLERKVDERTRELDERNHGMRLVLDNVAQGFVTIAVADGVLASERSAVFDRWFGVPAARVTLAEHLRGQSQTFSEWVEIGLAQLRDGFMPSELTLDQLPKRCSAGGRVFDMNYTPIGGGEVPDRLLVIFSDVTDKLARDRAEAEQKELLAFFQRVSVDRSGVEEFVTEAAQLVGALRQETEPVIQRRLVHTLKGNCAIYGMASIADLAHSVESELAETGAALSPEQRDMLVNGWKQAVQRVGWLLTSQKRETVEIERGELDAFARRAQQGASQSEIARTLADWGREPVHPRLERLGRQARTLARRLDKPEPEVVVQDRSVRLDAAPWPMFWAALVHVVRNAVDHGLESSSERLLASKPEAGKLWLGAERDGDRIIITVRDDGRGVDWERVRAKARKLGMPAVSESDLLNALFADGLSTRDEVSMTSGRGVGLSAVKQSVQELGGKIEVDTLLGQGTTFRFTFEEHVAKAAQVPRMVSSSLMPALS